jgi:transposase
MQRMLSMRDLKAQDLHGLTPDAVKALAAQMLEHIIERKDREIAWRDAKLEKLNFELARLKRWKFGAKTESMTAEQRRLFAETLAEDEASLQAQLAELQRGLPRGAGQTPKAPRAAPSPGAARAPANASSITTSPRTPPARTPTAAADAAHRRGRQREAGHHPGEFFVHRHIYGKWACRCCQQLRRSRPSRR